MANLDSLEMGALANFLSEKCLRLLCGLGTTAAGSSGAGAGFTAAAAVGPARGALALIFLVLFLRAPRPTPRPAREALVDIRIAA